MDFRSKLDFQSSREILPSGLLIVSELVGAIDGSTILKFENHLEKLYDSEARNVLLDFSGVGYINSTGMGILAILSEKFEKDGRSIKLVNAPERIIIGFEVVELLSLVEIHRTKEDVIASL